MLGETFARPVDAMVPIASKRKGTVYSDAIGTIASTGDGCLATASVGLLVLAVALAALPASALSWKGLDRIPAEAVDGSGLGKEALERRLDEIAAENAGRPFVVVKTKWMAEIFDRARLSVLPDDRFVDCFPEWYVYTDRRDRAVGKFMAAHDSPVRTVATPWFDTSHTCPDWKAVLTLGPKGLADRARARLATAKDERERQYLTCVADSYEAIRRLCRRWADVAEGRDAGACAADLRAIADNPPRTFAQALQWSLVYDRCQEAEGEDVRSQGQFDRLFIGFYRDDLAAGRETRASAKELMRRYFDKFYRQGHPNGKSISLAGFDCKGNPVWTELTDIALELHYELNRVNPKFTFVYGKATPHGQLLKAAHCLADGRTSIVFFNADTAGEMFMRRGKECADLQDMGLIGCYEPAILGQEVIASMAARINLAKPIEAALNGGCDFKGRRVGPVCDLPTDGAAFEREYLRQLGSLLKETLAVARGWERHWMELNPAPIFSGTFANCIDTARDAYDGGCKYNQSGVVLVGLGTVADALAAVRYLVDEAKLVTMSELGEILRNDWKGHEELRLKARRLPPKWGNNDDRADAGAKRVYDFAAALVNAEPNGHGGTFQAGFWSIFLDLDYGRVTAATPEGRRSGEPLSRNNVATAGCGKEGPTALLLSNAKLDLANAADGHILDVILPASVRKGDGADGRVATFLETFVRFGGQSIHMNCFDSKTLREAKAHPDRYPDLQVRVCGWNVRWSDLSPVEQDHFIATAEAQE